MTAADAACSGASDVHLLVSPGPALAVLPPVAFWIGLLAGSGTLAGLFALLALPAALLLGAMLTGIAFGAAGAPLRVPKACFAAAQAVLGCLVAHAFTPDFAATLLADGPLMLAVVLVTVATGALVGLVLTRLRVLPGATAAWGSSPGGAAAMVAMSEAFGSDPRLVAFMQYVRVALVVLTAALVTRLSAESGTPVPIPPVAQHEGSVLATLIVAAIGAGTATRLHMPAGAMLGPMLLGALVQGTGLARLAVPDLVLSAAYVTIGWYVGLRFTRETLRITSHALPSVLGATLAVILLCAGWAWALTRLLSIDFLTAFLATSPGGLDSVAIIALGSKADMSFVLSVQTLRLFVVLATGPALARWITRLAPEPPG